LSKAEKIVEQMIVNDHFSQWLGIEVLEVKEGFARIQMCVTSEMLNGHGIAHGGISFSLADSAFAFASNAHGSEQLWPFRTWPSSVPWDADRRWVEQESCSLFFSLLVLSRCYCCWQMELTTWDSPSKGSNNHEKQKIAFPELGIAGTLPPLFAPRMSHSYFPQVANGQWKKRVGTPCWFIWTTSAEVSWISSCRTWWKGHPSDRHLS